MIDTTAERILEVGMRAGFSPYASLPESVVVELLRIKQRHDRIAAVFLEAVKATEAEPPPDLSTGQADPTPAQVLDTVLANHAQLTVQNHLLAALVDVYRLESEIQGKVMQRKDAQIAVLRHSKRKLIDELEQYREKEGAQ